MNFEEISIPTKTTRDTCLWAYSVPDYENVNKKIISTIEKYKKTKKENYTDDININVWQTNWEMYDEVGFREICDIAKNLTISISTKHYNFSNFYPSVVDCWCNIYTMNSGCRVHQHFPATFSLVYYVEVPDNSGDIFFPDLECKITPLTGLLLCFRGDTWHGVRFNYTNKDRIVIGINIVYNNQKA